MIVRFTVVCVICSVLGSIHETSAEPRDKLKIHVPQHIRDIHHYHKETIHHYHHKQQGQYAGGYGYGPPSKKPSYHHRDSHNSVYHGGSKGGGRYKSRGGPRRNNGSKRYGMNNYAGKYGNWVNNGPPRKDLHGSGTNHRVQNLRPHRDSSFRRPPAPIDEDAEDEGEEEAPRQPPRDYENTRERDNAHHLKQNPSQVGEKIHANINEILGLISKYSGRREHLDQVRQHEGSVGHQRSPPRQQYQVPNQRQHFQQPTQFSGFEQQNFNNYHFQSPVTQRNPHNEVTQTFQTILYRGRQPEYNHVVVPQLPPPVVLGSIGGGIAFNRFQSGRVDGDHDIGFGQGLEVIQEGTRF